MPQPSAAYAAGRVRALEKTMLTRSAIDRLCSAATVREIARMLSESGYGDAYDQAGVERLADRRLSDACKLLNECSPEPNITDCFLVKFDVLNLKTLLKARLLKQAEPMLTQNGLLDIETLKHAVSDASYKFLPPEYGDTLRAIERRIAIHADPLFIDTELDKLMFRMISEKLARVKHVPEAISAYFSARSDMTNMLIALRVKQMGRSPEFASGLYVVGGTLDQHELSAICDEPSKLLRFCLYKPYYAYLKRGMAEYSKGEGLSALEKQMDDYLFSLIEPHRFDIDSVLPLISYFMAREREAAAVRLIVTAKAVNAPQEALNSRLRALYA